MKAFEDKTGKIKIKPESSFKDNKKEAAMMSVIINGKNVFAAPGETILNVVHDLNIDHIPTLCHDSRIEPYGSCFLCVVEVEGMSKLVPSCCTPVSPGMTVRTDSPRIREARKAALELLLSNHYADCIGPCMNNCPAHVDCQGYLALASMGKFQEALRLIKQQNPLPLSIGRVCVRDCEVACRREMVDSPVAINAVKRFTADMDSGGKKMWTPEIKARNGKKVAVIGAGPSGLTCAYYLNLQGYDVTIFEKLPRPGGMLMYGIPEYRLPKDILQKEIDWILGLGITLKTNVALGTDIHTAGLLSGGYSVVYLAVGAHKASTMRLENEDDTKGVMWGIDFLRRAVEKPPRLDGTVVIVGGGNTAVDAARTALRCGAENVKIVYRRSIKEMPAHEEEIRAAQHEGIDIMFLTNPAAILRDKDRALTGIRCIKMKLEQAEPGQRPRPVPIDGSQFDLPCSYLIGAIGQAVDMTFAGQDPSLELSRWGTVNVNEHTYETSIPGVFSGGDVVTGPYTAISAIAQGKAAALSIHANIEKNISKDKDLNTGASDNTCDAASFLSFKHQLAEVSELEFSNVPKKARETMPELPVPERIAGYDEVELGFAPSQTQCETSRCLSCGCSEYTECMLREYAGQYHVDIKPFIGLTRKYQIDNRHPFIALDPNKCINCGRCVRTCSEILEVSALGFVDRGFSAVVKPAMEKALIETNCVSCGNCIDTCPTGALTERFPKPVPGTLERETFSTVCHFCSVGCTLNVKVIDRDLFYVSNNGDEWKHDSINNGYLCVKGRFGHRYLNRADRPEVPMVRVNGRLESSQWETAVEKTVHGLQEVIDAHGPGSVAVFAAPNLSNQDFYLLQKLARAGLKTNNIASLSNVFNAPGQTASDLFLGDTLSTASVRDIASADVVVVINGNLSEENLVMELKIKEAIKKNKTRLVLMNSSEIKLAKFAHLWADARRGSNTAVLNGVMRHLIKSGAIDKKISEKPEFQKLQDMVESCGEENVSALAGIPVEKFRQLLPYLSDPEAKIVFIYNLDSRIEKSPYDLQAIGNFLLLTDRFHRRDRGGVLLLRDHANAVGALDMGATPYYLPGRIKPRDTEAVSRIGERWNTDLKELFKYTPGRLLQRLLDGQIKAALVIGEDPLAHPENRELFSRLQFLAVSDLTLTATASEAHVFFPAASPLEQKGTYTACDHRTQTVQAVFPNQPRLDNLTLFQMLLNRLRPDIPAADFNTVETEISDLLELARQSTQIDPFEKPKLNFSIHPVDVTPFPPPPPSIIPRENFYRTNIKERLMI